MGQTKSGLVKAYNEEYLHYYIQRNDLTNIELILQKRPELIQAALTHKTRMTPLYRACYNGNLKMVEFFIEKCNANINHLTEIGQTPLMAATKRNHLKIVRYLIAKGADVNLVSPGGISTLQFAIIPGFYQVALQIYQLVKEKSLKTIDQYEQWAKLYFYRYVNYKVFLQFLQKKVDPQNVSDFLTELKIVYKDPVADPRQTWKAWVKRQIEFKDPPLVQRDDLPQQLQPQNRKFGKLKSILSNMARSPMVQKSHFQPRRSNSVNAPQTENQLKKTNPLIGEQLETHTVS